jgi:hypothetical protein
MRWKVQTEKDWHTHFAFLPVKVQGEWVWLERVLRRGWKSNPTAKRNGWTWNYVNSEFDLLKIAEKENATQERNVAQGQVMRQTAPAGLGLKPLGTDPAQNSLNLSESQLKKMLGWAEKA